jgi:hypothetical protein
VRTLGQSGVQLCVSMNTPRGALLRAVGAATAAAAGLTAYNAPGVCCGDCIASFNASTDVERSVRPQQHTPHSWNEVRSSTELVKTESGGAWSAAEQLSVEEMEVRAPYLSPPPVALPLGSHHA